MKITMQYRRVTAMFCLHLTAKYLSGVSPS